MRGLSASPRRAARDSGHLAEFLVAMAHPGVGQALGVAMRDSVLVSWCVNLGPVLDAIIGHHGGPVDRKEIDACAARVTSLWSSAAGYDPITEVRLLRIPMKPARHSNRKPATDSDLKPAGIPI